MTRIHVTEISPLRATVTHRELAARLPDWVDGIDNLALDVVDYAVEGILPAPQARLIHQELVRLKQELEAFARDNLGANDG